MGIRRGIAERPFLPPARESHLKFGLFWILFWVLYLIYPLLKRKKKQIFTSINGHVTHHLAAGCNDFISTKFSLKNPLF